MKTFSALLLIGLLSGLSYLTWNYRDQISAVYESKIKIQSQKAKQIPDPDLYQELKSNLRNQHAELSQRDKKAKNSTERELIKKEARDVLESALPQLMRCWLGTPWDFNATSQEPGSGKIACGYFVSTIMRDAGFKVERIKLAQQPSQNIIRTFLPRSQMHVRTQTSYSQFLKQVTDRGPGIRIVGLDRHVAFLVINPDLSMRFIHSSGAAAKCVVDEGRDHAYTLKGSQYRVTGNITRHEEVIEQWLTQQPLRTKT